MFDYEMDNRGKAIEPQIHIGPWNLRELMTTGDLLGTGPVRALERRLAGLYGRRHAVCVASATAGLYAVATALDLRGHEVLTAPYGWGGAVGAMLTAGASVAFADVEPVGATLCAASTAREVRRATRAILAIDLFGTPADTATLRAVADAHGLYLIHDGAQSLGASRGGRPPGAGAHASVVSFSPGKALSLGEGGVVLTDDEALYRRLVAQTQHPLRQRRELGLAESNELGLHARMHPVAAAWGWVHIDRALERCRLRQERGLEMLASAEQVGACSPFGFSRDGILPGFLRVAASWHSRAMPRRLASHLRCSGHGAWSVEPWPLVPLTTIPALRGVVQHYPATERWHRKGFILSATHCDASASAPDPTHRRRVCRAG